MKKVFWIILCMFFIPPVTFAGNMKLHYDRPAEYFEEALVIGNGTILSVAASLLPFLL